MHSERVVLPYSQLTEEVNFAVEAERWRELELALRAAAPNEACTFVLSRPSRGSRRTTCLLGEAIWPREGDLIAAPHKLEISADYIARAIDAAIDAGDMVGLTLIHTHPETEFGPGRGVFSARDDWYEARLFPTVLLDRPRVVAGSIVLGSSASEIDARIWWNDGEQILTQPAQVVRVVGPELRFLEGPHSEWTDHADPEMMDRSTRIWGGAGRRILQNLRVGVVGAGGTGSIVLASVVTMGVGKVDIWDADRIKKENLHRTLGARRDMLGRNKAMALSEWLREVATADPFEINPFDQWGTSEDGLRGLKDCDIIFCCVDRFAPRVALNDLAYAHLIPTIDMASWLHPSGDIIDAFMTHAHVWSPGIPCAWCRETLTSRRLTREAQGIQADVEFRAAYGVPLDATDGIEPSVLPLNLAGVGLAMLEFMQVALQVTDRTPRDLKLLLPNWELDESDLSSLPSCSTENKVGFGDVAVIAPVLPQD